MSQKITKPEDLALAHKLAERIPNSCKQFAELQEAWKDVIRIKVGRTEDDCRVEYAIGIEPTNVTK